MENISVIGCSICSVKNVTISKTHKKKIVEALKRISEKIVQVINFQDDA